MSVGRVNDGTIGVIGIDGAFGNDGHFHPISSEQQGESVCGRTDARGHAFVNAKLQDVSLSGLTGRSKAQGCRPQGAASFSEGDCPTADLREISYGLLGPDAVSLTYELPDHQLHKLDKLGPGGSYLIVMPQGPLYQGNTSGPGVSSGVIASVAYKGGHVCHVAFASLFESCPPIGFDEARRSLPPASQLASTIHVNVKRASRYCVQSQSPEGRIVPCAKDTPSGFRSIRPKTPSVLAVISFRSPVGINEGASHYEIQATYPHSSKCPDEGTAAPTDSDYRAGQDVARYVLIPTSCAGVVHGRVTYVLTRGATTPAPNTGANEGRSRLVSRFSFAVPKQD